MYIELKKWIDSLHSHVVVFTFACETLGFHHYRIKRLVFVVIIYLKAAQVRLNYLVSVSWCLHELDIMEIHSEHFVTCKYTRYIDLAHFNWHGCFVLFLKVWTPMFWLIVDVNIIQHFEFFALRNNFISLVRNVFWRRIAKLNNFVFDIFVCRNIQCYHLTFKF